MRSPSTLSEPKICKAFFEAPNRKMLYTSMTPIKPHWFTKGKGSSKMSKWFMDTPMSNVDVNHVININCRV